MIRAWLARRVVQSAYDGMANRDPSRALAAFAPAARFRFAGDHSWAIDTTDPGRRRAWFERFAALGPRLSIETVLVAGPPWAMRITVVFDDEIRDLTNSVVYRNHGVQYVQMRRGRITFDEINLDTQKVAEFDRLNLEGAAASPGE